MIVYLVVVRAPVIAAGIFVVNISHISTTLHAIQIQCNAYCIHTVLHYNGLLELKIVTSLLWAIDVHIGGMQLVKTAKY